MLPPLSLGCLLLGRMLNQLRPLARAWLNSVDIFRQLAASGQHLFCNLVSSLVLLGLDYIRLLGRLASTFSLCLSYVSGEILL